MSKTTIAVIGAGWWATYNHLPALEENNNVHRVVVVDNDKERLSIIQQEFSIDAVYDDIDDMLESEKVNGAIVATPHTFHFEHAAKCITKRVPVLLVEKPMTTSAKDARKLVRLARVNSTEILIANGWNFTPYISKGREKIQEDAIGTIQHVVAQMASPVADLFNGEPMQGTEPHIFRPPKSTWADPKKAGGYGWGQMSHLLAALYYLIDDAPKSVYATFQLSKAKVDYYDAAILKTKAETTICLSGASTMPKHSGYMMDIRIFGTKGVLAFDIERERMAIMKHSGEDIEIDIESGEGNYPERTPIDYFIACCQGKPINNLANSIVGQRVVETLDLMYRSAKSGEKKFINKII